VFNNNPRAYRTLIEGARDAGFQVIVSAGASHEELAFLQSDLVRIRRHVPQVALLKQVDVVITHGGNNTVQECLAAGRPMVVVPFGGDQWANARRVERLGVGVHLDPSSLTSSAVRRAVGHISQASVVQTSQALAASLVNYGGAAAATDAILDLIAARG
jgi:MGT family glycosyltransferase